MTSDEWSIQQIAKLAGTTSRALRHYGEVGVLDPSRIGHNGYRYYDQRALIRLQRILLLRELGLGLPQVAEVLGRDGSEGEALRIHLEALRHEQGRLARQIASVERTIQAVERGERMMAEDMFDGFDHARYEEEVTDRWGARAWAVGDAWWNEKSATEKADFSQIVAELNAEWVSTAGSGELPSSERAQHVAARHVRWLTAVPGTPANTADGDVKGYVLGLGDMYVADPRFGANYATAAGGSAGAEFVRDALRVYAQAHL